MNTIQINNKDRRYDRITNKILYQNIHQYKCPICLYTQCICNNNNNNISKKNHIYNSFNMDSVPQQQSINNNKKISFLNKLKIKPTKNSFLNENNKFSFFSPLSNRDSQQKKLNSYFIFNNNNENYTISQNNANYISKINIDDDCSNIKKGQYFQLNQRSPCLNYKKQNSSVLGKGLSSFINNINNICSMSEFQVINQSPKLNNKKKLTLNKSNKNYILNDNYEDLSSRREKKSKFRKIFNEKDIKLKNKTIENTGYNSYININLRSLNNNRIKNIKKNKEYFSPCINNRVNNQTKKISFFKKANSSNININNNNKTTNSNNINLNINNNYHCQISSSNIFNIPQNSIEQMKKYYSSNLHNISYDKNDVKSIICLRRRNKTINNKDTVKSEEECFKNKNKKIFNKYIILENKHKENKAYNNQIPNSKRTGNKSEFSDTNKENYSNNIMQDYYLINNQNKKKLNIKIFDEIKKNYSKKISSIESKINNLNKNNYNNNKYLKISINGKNNGNQELNQNYHTEINNCKLKTFELMSLLNKANDEINQLKLELNGYKKIDNDKFLNKSYKKINKNKFYNNISNINPKNNFQKKNCLKIKIPEGNINSQLSKNINSNLTSEITILNKQNTNNLQSMTTLNTSNTKNISNDVYYINYNNTNANINKKSYRKKYIFALYYSLQENYKNFILCFDAETKSFKIKNTNNFKNFNKHFYESINKTNMLSRSIYLINNNNYYIVTGLNCNKFYQYNFKQNKINQFNDLVYNHSNGVMITYCDKIICLSGDYNKKVELYLDDENKWVELPEMQVERSHFSSTIIKNKYIFSFFGYNAPNKTYLNSIEYLDINDCNMKIKTKKTKKNNTIYWRYLEYNYFSNRPSYKKINLIGSVAVNYNNEKIIFLGGKNYLRKDDDEGYYQLILDDTKIINEEIDGYIEKINTKGLTNFKVNYFFNYDYKYIEELNQDNILKEPVFVAFDNNYFVHLLKLSTMNHEIYKIN